MNLGHIFICRVHIIFILSVFYSFHGLRRTQQTGQLRPHGFSLRKLRDGKPWGSTRSQIGLLPMYGSSFLSWWSSSALTQRPYAWISLKIPYCCCCCCFLVRGVELNLQLLKSLRQPQRSYLHLNDSALSARQSLAIGLATNCSATFRQFFIFSVAFFKLFFTFFATFTTFRKKSQLISSQHRAPTLVLCPQIRQIPLDPKKPIWNPPIGHKVDLASLKASAKWPIYLQSVLILCKSKLHENPEMSPAPW